MSKPNSKKMFMNVRVGNSKKNLLFFLIAVVVIILIMIRANYSSDLLLELFPPKEGARKLFTSGNQLVAVSNQNEVYIWDWDNLSADPQKGTVKAQDLTWMQPGRLVWSPFAGPDIIIVSDLQGMEEYKRISIQQPWHCQILRTSRNGKFAAVSMIDETAGRIQIGLLNDKFEKIDSIVNLPARGDGFELNNVTVSEDGMLLAAVGGGDGGWVGVVDTKQKKVLWQKVPPGATKMNEVTFSPDGKMVYAGGRGKVVYGFETLTGKIVYKWIVAHVKFKVKGTEEENVTVIDVSPNSRLLAAAGTRTKIFLWNAITTEAVSSKSHGHISTVGEMAFSQDGSQLATVGTAATDKINIWRITQAR